MPIVYRENTPSTSRYSDPVPTNADDSIVLSDLVRTGEASRLRRRGAMRIDHTQVDGENAAQIIVSPPWGSEPDPEPDDSPVFARNIDRERPLRYGYAGGGAARSRGEVCEDTEDAGYTLFCGGEEVEWGAEAEVAQSCAPYKPSVLPLYPPQPSSPARRSSFGYRSLKRSNGCGALLHMQAAPRRRLAVWTAKSEASSGAVVALDPSYFDRAAMAKIVRSACGCIREGVGCAVCGNPLGTRYKPCKTAAEGIFSSRARARPSHPFRPEGPQYWHTPSSARARQTPSPPAHPHAHHSASHNPTPASSPFYVYTFFSASVMSAPAFAFPPRSALAPQAAPIPPQAQTPSQPPRHPRPVQYRARYQFQYQGPQALPPSIPAYIPTYRSPPSSPPPQSPTRESPPAPAPVPEEVPAAPTITSGSLTPTAGASPGPFVPPAQPPDSPPLAALFDRVLTASPVPVPGAEEREEEGGAYRYRYEYQYRTPEYRFGEDGEGEGAGAGRYDADGEFITEPSSPDKTGEAMLFPER